MIPHEEKPLHFPSGKFFVRYLCLQLIGVTTIGSIVLAPCRNVQATASDYAIYNNIGLGYLTAPSLSPGHILKPSSIFVLSTLDPEGTRRIDFDMHWANIWNYEPEQYLIDGEMICNNVRFTYALKDTLSLGITVPIVGRTGGFADPLIECFHKTFQLGNASRDEFPQNKSLMSVYTNGGSQTIVEGDSWGIGDVSVFAASRISDGNDIIPSILVQGQISLPTGDEDELRGLGAPSLSLSAVASKRLGRSPLILFGGLGFQYCPADESAGLEVYHEEWAGLAGLEYQLIPSLSLVAQYLGSSPVAKDYFAFSDPSHEVSVGCKWRITRKIIVEFAVVENILIFNNSADIGAHFCLGSDL